MMKVASKYMMLDLFSGFGGASEAFVQSSAWDVVRIENNPLLKDVPHTFMNDVKDIEGDLQMLDAMRRWRLDVMWASPPCDEFSDARAGTEKPPEPDLSLVRSTIGIMMEIQPRYWVIENVRGSVKHLEPLLGPPRQIIDGIIFLWGNFPLLQLPRDWKRPSKFEGDTWSTDPLRPNRRALIPLEISQALLEAVGSQRQLTEWLS